MTNQSGILPTEFKVLILPDEASDKFTLKDGKASSLIKPDTVKDQDSFAQIDGTIIAVSRLAFSYATAAEWGDEKPKTGDRVSYARYAGALKKGRDGKDYRIVNDKDIFAVLT